MISYKANFFRPLHYFKDGLQEDNAADYYFLLFLCLRELHRNHQLGTTSDQYGAGDRRPIEHNRAYTGPVPDWKK